MGGRFRLHMMANAWWQPLTFAVPEPGDGYGAWQCWIDTALPSPQDCLAWDAEAPLVASRCDLIPRSIQVLRTEAHPRE